MPNELILFLNSFINKFFDFFDFVANKIFFFQKSKYKRFREFKGYFLRKVLKKIFESFSSYINFKYSDENHYKSKYLPKY